MMRFRRKTSFESLIAKPCEIIDHDLSKPARRIANTLILSMIPPLESRAMSVFMESEKYDSSARVFDDIHFNLRMECFKRFVRANGGQIVYIANMDRHEQTGRPRKRVINVGDGHCHIVTEGYVFVHFPNERVVLGISRPIEFRDLTEINLISNVNAGDFWDRWEKFASQNNYLLGQAFFADGAIIRRTRKYTWDDIVLPEDIKQAIRIYIYSFLNCRDRLSALGVKKRRGLILAGPPGTGKTLIGKILADTLETSFLWVTPRHIRGPGSFNEILMLARFLSPTVLFLEDLDLFAEEREHTSWTGLGELMNQLDGVVENENIVTIATTNRLEVIEKALRNRPGRFDRILRIDTLDASCRRQHLDKLLVKAAISNDEINEIVRATDGYTGAQLEELANTIYLLAVHGETDQPDRKIDEKITIDKTLIEQAIAAVTVEEKTRLGFHAA